MIVLAQQDVSFQDILSYLGPSSPPGFIWNIIMYVIFFLALVTMLLQSDKALTPTLLMAVVLAAVVIDKLQIMERQAAPLFNQPGLWTFLLHCVMFAVPLLVAGATKAAKSRGPAILTGIIGGIYLFGYWVFVQNRV